MCLIIEYQYFNGYAESGLNADVLGSGKESGDIGRVGLAPFLINSAEVN